VWWFTPASPALGRLRWVDNLSSGVQEHGNIVRPISKKRKERERERKGGRKERRKEGRKKGR
jgi:hypothetical protein